MRHTLPQKGKIVPSLGILIGGPITLLLVALCVLIYKKSEWVEDKTDGLMSAKGFRRSAVVVGIIVVVTALACYFPYKWEYHSWSEKSGTVASVSSRIITESESINQKFVVTFASDPSQEYGCEDTRCALIEQNDLVVLTCKRAFQFNGYDGWDCQFRSRTPGSAKATASS